MTQTQLMTRYGIKQGDDWISLAMLTENPRCGLTMVFKPDGSWDLVGTCFEKHSHCGAIERLVNQKLARVLESDQAK